MPKSRIYLDYASLTPVDPRVLKVVNKYSSNKYANPSSWYREGVEAKEALESARAESAGFLRARPHEVIFTSGGTESNNLAILGVVEEYLRQGKKYEDLHILVSAIEHSSIIECANYLKSKGVAVDFISVNKEGVISLDELKEKIKPNTVLVSVMTVNNEIGTIQPIREISKAIRGEASRRGLSKVPIFHTDASQAALYEELHVERMGVNLLTLDSSKVYGPRGTGILYIKTGISVSPVIHGGGQEEGIRSGTENLASALGLAEALQIADKERNKELERISHLKEYFYNGLKNICPDISRNPESTDAPVSSHILNVSIPGIDNEFFVLQLDAMGIACSTKSSCLRDEDESYVLKAIGADSKVSVRFSFGRSTKKTDITRVLKVIKEVIGK